MPQTLAYRKVRRLPVLHDQLLAAGITPLLVKGDDSGADAQSITIVVADGVTKASVDAIVAAHDAAAPTQREQDAATRRAAVETRVSALVGKTWDSMVAGERQTIIVALLYKLDVIDKDLKIRPLAEWL